MYSRRLFLQNVFLFSGLLAACRKKDSVQMDDNLLEHNFDQKISFKQDCKLLFIGDSITDAKRDRTILTPNDMNGLGNGYVKEVAIALFQKPAFEKGAIYNRGIGGNTIADLVNRWDSDAIELRPDVVSILIGVNDIRRGNPSDYYYKYYRSILSKIKQSLPHTSIILCEPFILPNIQGYDNFKQNFLDYRKVVRKLAIEFNTFFVPYFSAFESSSQTTAASNLLYDGIHPTNLGITILKDKWLGICMF
ncbi:SGNH/GDSL hydrolase family protein [Chitinophaga qingshengii]|uniref:Lysophospholipase n=1 Tax=Chitinophaga qingshengii TaxID=1569794 RepID=A0ABR7TWM0_9BACT|nr:GDSL-type esterase/lipase family protein [Chitinophaga qingshengii]MBC9934880.1 lysophospholipase [Chitinophaga qingshengii]